jgi:hypothetical protein
MVTREPDRSVWAERTPLWLGDRRTGADRKDLHVERSFRVNSPYLSDQLSCIALAHLRQIAHWSRELLNRNRGLANEFVVATPEAQCEQLELARFCSQELITRT